MTGPTAVGKTGLSIGLARALGGEIISADSMQIYKKMNIGTAKITPDEMGGIPHYLVDELDPREEFHVARFQKMAREAMEQIHAHGHIPILVGGTGFYIQAAAYDVDFSPHDASENYRKELQRLLAEKGKEYLHDRLKEVDPAYAGEVHSNNAKRVIRALEYYHETGERLSDHNKIQRERTSPYQLFYFVLDMDRSVLYERINRRVDLMMEAGLLEEVRNLIDEGCTRDMVSMQGIGYKEFFPYFAGECSLEETVEQIKTDTRHFAKRQLTWFRREKDVIWIKKEDYPDEQALTEYIIRKISPAVSRRG